MLANVVSIKVKQQMPKIKKLEARFIQRLNFKCYLPIVTAVDDICIVQLALYVKFFNEAAHHVVNSLQCAQSCAVHLIKLLNSSLVRLLQLFPERCRLCGHRRIEIGRAGHYKIEKEMVRYILASPLFCILPLTSLKRCAWRAAEMGGVVTIPGPSSKAKLLCGAIGATQRKNGFSVSRWFWSARTAFAWTTSVWY